MNLPSPLRDHLFVRVNAERLDRTESGIYIPDWQPGDKDAVRAEVVAAPLALSRERPLDYPGMDGHVYTYADLCDIPQPGSIVYLKPNTLKPELEYPGEKGVFLISLDKVVALDSDERSERQFLWNGTKGPTPFQGLLLCEEVWDEDVRVQYGGRRVRVKPHPDVRREKMNIGVELIFTPADIDISGELVTEVNPLPIPFTLRILHTGTPLRGQEDLVATGDVILADRRIFAYHAVKQDDIADGDGTERFMWQPPRIVIEGKEYAYCPRQMVMGKQLSAQPVAVAV